MLQRLLRSSSAFSQSPSKPIGLSLFFLMLLWNENWERSQRPSSTMSSCTSQSQAHNIAKRRSLRLRWNLSSRIFSGVSLQDAAAVHVSASEQKLELGGKTPVGNGEWESDPFNLDPTVKIWRNMTAQLGLRSSIRKWGSQQWSFADRV